MARKLKLSVVLLALQVLFLILFGVFFTYAKTPATVVRLYSYFQDVHVMIFVGFGFLMTFLKRYGYSAIGYNLLIAAMTIQWASIVNGLWSMLVMEGTPADHWGFSIGFIVNMDFATATVLISFGAVLGKTGPTQLLIMALLETAFSQVNKWLGLAKLKVEDAGESMFIHMFGAYFGLTVARILHNDNASENKKEASSYNSDIFSMIGTIFLWVFWPSFNAALAHGGDQERAILNTYYSMAACTVIAVALSVATDPKGKISMVHVQNATLAGGVAMGTAARMPIGVWLAALVGAVAGVLSLVGFQFLSPALKKLKIHDTCGVHNLHGLPGIWGALVGALGAILAGFEGWNKSMYSIFPAMIPEGADWHHFNHTHHPVARSAMEQGGYQLLMLVVTLILAIVAGAITGFVMKLPIWDSPNEDHLFDDSEKWNMAEEGVEEHHSNNANSAGHHELDAKV
ncbi:hypothetical protein ScPMuIL_002836 [Solemya velum]